VTVYDSAGKIAVTSNRNPIKTIESFSENLFKVTPGFKVAPVYGVPLLAPCSTKRLKYEFGRPGLQWMECRLVDFQSTNRLVSVD
jgi:hypothetical protein